MDQNFEKKLTDSLDWLSGEYNGIRSGQATPALLDNIKVESYGVMTPLNQVGSVGIEDARTLRVTPWDASSIGAIEKAVNEADLGVSVATDSAGLRVVFPELTTERREQILRLAKTKLEEARVRARSARDEAIKQIDAKLKAGDISEDDRFSQKEAVQGKIDDFNKKLDALYSQKETEISS